MPETVPVEKENVRVSEIVFFRKKKKRNAAMLDKKVSIEFVINLSLKRLNFSKPCDVDKPVVDENVQSTAV